MDPVVITIPGEARGKGAPRFRKVKAKDGREFNMAYLDKDTATYIGVVKTLAMQAMRGRPPIEGPVHVALIVRVVPPDSWPAWKRVAAVQDLIRPSGIKPDADNVKKAVYDGFTGVVWLDDTQVCGWAGRKEYHERPAVLVKITPMWQASSKITRRDQLPARPALEQAA